MVQMSHKPFQLTISTLLIQSRLGAMQTLRELKARTYSFQHVHSLRYIDQAKLTRRHCQALAERLEPHFFAVNVISYCSHIYVDRVLFLVRINMHERWVVLLGQGIPYLCYQPGTAYPISSEFVPEYAIILWNDRDQLSSIPEARLISGGVVGTRSYLQLSQSYPEVAMHTTHKISGACHPPPLN